MHLWRFDTGITMLRADLYEKSIRLESYVSPHDCRACGFQSRREFLERLRAGSLKPAQCGLTRSRLLSLLWAASPGELLPQVEVLQLPDPVPAGLIPVNAPGSRSPILISGNSRLTVEVLAAVLATTSSPFWYFLVDTQGHTVDMALVYQVLTADRIGQAFLEEPALRQAVKAPLVLPGLAAPLREKLAEQARRTVTVGPVCAAELPLFFGEQAWQVSC